MIVCCDVYDWFQRIPFFAGVVNWSVEVEVVSALETRVVHPFSQFSVALPSIAAVPFPIFSIGPPISCFLLATSDYLPFLLYVANPAASPLALEAAPAQVLQEELPVLQEELPVLQTRPQRLLQLPPPLQPLLQMRTLQIVFLRLQLLLFRR